MLSGPRDCQSLQYELLGRSPGRHNPRKLTYLSPTATFKVDPNPAFCCCCFQRFCKCCKSLNAARSCCLNPAPQLPTAAAAAPCADTIFAAEPSVQFSHQLLVDGCKQGHSQAASATCWSPDGEGTWIRGALCAAAQWSWSCQRGGERGAGAPVLPLGALGRWMAPAPFRTRSRRSDSVLIPSIFLPSSMQVLDVLVLPTPIMGEQYPGQRQ